MDSSPFQVAVNGRFMRQPFTGVQRYAWELSRRLPVSQVIAPGPPLPPYAAIGRPVTIRPGLRRLPGHAWEQSVLPRALSRNQLLWSPGGSGPLAVRRQVLTIHDAAHLEHPEWYSRSFSLWYRALLPVLARRVRRVLTVSAFSRMRLAAALRLNPERIAVTPLAADPRFRVKQPEAVAAGLHELGVSGPYVLAVAALSARKNFERLYRAWEVVAPGLEGTRLVVVGKTGLAFSNISDRGRLPSHTQVFQHVEDEQLVDLYNGATAFVFPSLYEGFGLPVLEAMACGTPVITSDITSLPEVAGDAALLVDPYDTGAIADALQRLAGDTALQAHLTGAGLHRAAQFSWERTAARTWELLAEAAGQFTATGEHAA